LTNKDFKVFDSDMHCMEPPDLWQRYIDKPFRHRAPVGMQRSFYDAGYQLEGHIMPKLLEKGKTPPFNTSHYLLMDRLKQRFKTFSDRNWGPECQIEAMDAEGIDLAAIFPTRGLYAVAMDDLDTDFAAAIVRAYNNWIYDYCNHNPQRLLPVGLISPHNVDDAIRESRRVMTELGFKGVSMRPNLVKGRNWHDEYYDPLWAELQQLNAPMAFHAAMGPMLPEVGQRFGDNVFLRHVACSPMEMMLAALSITGGGVFHRFPGLRIGFLEGNCGWVPWLIDRMDDHFDMHFFVNLDDMPQPPSFYFKRQAYVSVEPDERFVAQVINYMGSAQILFSTDWPHPDSKYPHSVQTFLETPISKIDKQRILWDNTAQFYGIS